jgi:hypothetical protein
MYGCLCAEFCGLETLTSVRVAFARMYLTQKLSRPHRVRPNVKHRLALVLPGQLAVGRATVRCQTLNKPVDRRRPHVHRRRLVLRAQPKYGRCLTPSAAAYSGWRLDAEIRLTKSNSEEDIRFINSLS